MNSQDIKEIFRPEPRVTASHTPGPWHVNTLEKFPYSVHACGGCIAETQGQPEHEFNPYSKEERSANARLISAAPDLLAALRLISTLDASQVTTDPIGRMILSGHVEAAKSAIRKATN